MTKQETFKRRVRARMEHTGERYNAARRVLIGQASAGGRTWVSQPEASEESVREHTGRGWNEWCDLIDLGPGRTAGHTAIAAWLQQEHDVGSWWAQSVTVGYERITGMRLPNQMADGTFTATRSRTLALDVEALREMLLSDEDRIDLFPAQHTELRSRSTAKRIRLGVGGGVAEFAFDPKGEGRFRVSVTHSKLSDVDALEQWKFYWTEWLEALDTD